MSEHLTIQDQAYINLINRMDEVSKWARSTFTAHMIKAGKHFTIVNDKRFIELLGLTNEKLLKVYIDNINPRDEESIEFYSYVYQNCQLIPTWETFIASE